MSASISVGIDPHPWTRARYRRTAPRTGGRSSSCRRKTSSALSSVVQSRDVDPTAPVSLEGLVRLDSPGPSRRSIRRAVWSLQRVQVLDPRKVNREGVSWSRFGIPRTALVARDRDVREPKHDEVDGEVGTRFSSRRNSSVCTCSPVTQAFASLGEALSTFFQPDVVPFGGRAMEPAIRLPYLFVRFRG